MSEQPKGQQPKQLNKDYMLASYKGLLAEANDRVAEGDAIIGGLTTKLQELEKDNENLRKELTKYERGDKEQDKAKSSAK